MQDAHSGALHILHAVTVVRPTADPWSNPC